MSAGTVGNTSNIIRINRSQPFNPATFFRFGWTIWKGPSDGNGLEGEEDHNERSLALIEIDLSKLSLEHYIRDRETTIPGYEKQERIKASGDIPLDIGFFWHFWRNQHQIPKSWRAEINGCVPWIGFDGTILRWLDGTRRVLYLKGKGRGRVDWDWDWGWLREGCSVRTPSLVLPMSTLEIPSSH